MKKKITIYCASSKNIEKKYLYEAYRLGRLAAENGFEIIYGGGNIGMMGELANGAIKHGGKVTGVIPEFLMDLELGHKGIDKLIVVKDLHARQRFMIENADCIIALPGACGTFTELLESITWKKLGRIICPIIIVNLNNYFDDLLNMLTKAIDEGFMREEHFKLWTVVDSIDDAVVKLYGNENFVHFDIV
ncbi:MAG: TIGR00730 family Rossman fold protein [Candidatus Kapaibacterium sp.]|jgi:uncharacterized protein (TIGR00730 family)|nr:TIGR00730 family Rossman fold protein [Candidatus Kapabacteria bacterium]